MITAGGGFIGRLIGCGGATSPTGDPGTVAGAAGAAGNIAPLPVAGAAGTGGNVVGTVVDAGAVVAG